MMPKEGPFQSRPISIFPELGGTNRESVNEGPVSRHVKGLPSS